MLTFSDSDPLVDTLKQLPSKMRKFSLSLLSLYVPNAIGTGVPQGKELETLRDATRLDAMIYNGGIQPMSTHVVLFLQEYFQNYTVLTFDEWNENLNGILKDVQGYKQCCDVLVNMHKGITITLTHREGLAQKIEEKIKAETKSFTREMLELIAEIAATAILGIVLLFVPVVGEEAEGVLAADGVSISEEVKEKIHEMHQSEENDAAIHVVGKTMIPALQYFVEGLDTIAGVFEKVEQDLISFIERGQGAEAEKKRHYLLMKNTGEKIETQCQQFFAVIPAMTSDLEAIPSGGTAGIVKQWKAEQYAGICKRYKKDMTVVLKQALTYLSG